MIASTLTIAADNLQDSTIAQTAPLPKTHSTQATDLLPKPTPVHSSTPTAPEQIKQPPEQSRSTPTPRQVPTIVPPEKLNPILTSTPVNDRVLSHQTGWDAAVNALYQLQSGKISSDFKATYRIDRRAERRITPDQLRVLDYRADYILFDTPISRRQVTIDITHQIKTLGQRLQFSLTGNCRNPESAPDDQCVYIPGLTTDNTPEAVDSQGNPSRIIVSPTGRGAAFDVLSSENLAAIQAPGFQQGLPDSDPRSQQVGVDFTTPNIGTIDSHIANYRRTEDVSLNPALSLVRVRRIIASSSDRAQLAQTIRGISLFTGDINQDALIGTSLMGITQLVPDVRPSLVGTGQEPDGANENLIVAANSARLPPNSFTAYHGGLATADNRIIAGRDLRQTFANFNSIWIGLSPIVDRRLETSNHLGRLVRQETLFSGGQEGGSNSGSAPNFDVLLLAPNLPDTRLTGDNLSNFYTQLYLTFFTSSGQQFDRAIITEKTRYVPSIAFTGNFANQNHLFQYYAGAIVDPDQLEQSKAYIGGAYSGSAPKHRWGWRIEGQGVLQPDPDYYSYISASIAKGWQLGNQPNRPVLFLSANGLYAFDRPTAQNKVTLSPVSFVSVGTGIDFGRMRFSLDYTPGLFGNDGIARSLITNAVIRLSDRMSLSGFYTLLTDSSSRTRSGAQLEMLMGSNSDSLRLTLGWSLNQSALGDRTFNDHRLMFGIRAGGR